jgi:hypothetical protein
MDFQLDIYELDDGHIHVVVRGDAEGMIDFGGSDVFAKFVTRCQEYIKDSRHAKKTMDWLNEQDVQFANPMTDADTVSTDDVSDNSET